MKYFIFRNNTVEPFFAGADYDFSGYDDISSVPAEAEGYIWCYQLPVKYDCGVMAEEVRSFMEKLRFTATRIAPEKPLLVFTLCDWSSVPLTDDDTRLPEAIAEYNAAVGELARRQAKKRLSAARKQKSRESIFRRFLLPASPAAATCTARAAIPDAITLPQMPRRQDSLTVRNGSKSLRKPMSSE